MTELPPIDIVVTMGCNVNCPYLPCKYRENWGLDDPSGKDEAEYRKTIAAIEQKMMALKEFVKENFEQSKPRVKRVVCTSPERAYYRQAS